MKQNCIVTEVKCIVHRSVILNGLKALRNVSSLCATKLTPYACASGCIRKRYLCVWNIDYTLSLHCHPPNVQINCEHSQKYTKGKLVKAGGFLHGSHLLVFYTAVAQHSILAHLGVSAVLWVVKPGVLIWQSSASSLQRYGPAGRCLYNLTVIWYYITQSWPRIRSWLSQDSCWLRQVFI